MTWRISLTISFLILITVFGLLFNYSMDALRKKLIENEAIEISTNKASRLYNTFTLEDKENLFKIPCDNIRQTSCLNLARIQKKLSDNVVGSAIVEADLVTKNMFSLAKAKKTSDRLRTLVIDAEKEGKSAFTETYVQEEGTKNIIVSVIHLYDMSNDSAVRGVFLITYSNPVLINNVMLPYNILLIASFFIPYALILLYIIKSGNSSARKLSEVLEENKRAISEIDRLKKENVQQSQFLANFTHELRTPLNSIIGFSGLIKDETLGTVGNDEYKKFATDINNSGVHLLSLINDILDYSKAEVGRLKVNIVETDVVKIVKQCFSIVAPRASESGVDLLQSLADEHFILRVDPKRLKQIVLNLLSNSVKFTPEGGSVTTSVFPDLKNNRLYVEVKDTGVGISEKDLPTVMSLFGQAETNLNRKYEGSGIGLPFAKKLTNLMGGSFEISSKVGIGTRVTLGFPFDKKLNAEFTNNLSPNKNLQEI